MPESKLMRTLPPLFWVIDYSVSAPIVTELVVYTVCLLCSHRRNVHILMCLLSEQPVNGPHNVHTRAFSLQNMITSSGVHVGQATAAVNERNICTTWFSLWGTSKFMLNPDAALLTWLESQGWLNLNAYSVYPPAGKLSVLFLVHPLCGKMHQHFLRRKCQKLVGEVRRQCVCLGAETLASVPSSTNNSKQQLLGRSIFH